VIQTIAIPTSNVPPHGAARILTTGADLASAGAAMIMIHGRGATAEGILDLAQYFNNDRIAYIAPQAAGTVWYPYSFLTAEKHNEPGLSSSLQLISDIVDYVVRSGIAEEKIFILGFSQGACLALEWSARAGRNISAVFGLSGGLIGESVDRARYSRALTNTVVFLGCSDVDFHIPKERVVESASVFESMGAKVLMNIYPNMAHTVSQDEIDVIAQHLSTLIGTS
jgi:predicted esterase